MQIDHDLILEDVPRILLELLRISNPFSSLFVFLELLLDYHVKTRTMNTHIENLFAALTPRSYSLDKDIRYVYQCSSSSALLHLTHLERLAKCTRTFLTSTQTVTIVRFILETLQTCWNQILAPADPESGQSNADNSTLALTFSFSARLASVVLSALPMQALPATLLAEVRHISGEIRDTFLPHALAKTIKAIRKNAHDSWTWQITAAAIIRLEYALDTQYSQKMWAKLVAASEDEHLLPELSLEIFRILLRWSSVGEKNGTPYPMDRLLDYLEDNFTSSEMSWGGASSSLTFGPQGKGECVLAILHMLIDRWLPVVDAIASGRQLQRLVRILVKNSGGEYVPSERLDATSLLLSAFSSAQFWELPNLRVAILAFADEATSTLADSEPRLTADGRAAILTTYQLLLLFPVEYISRTTRTELVRRAINADLLHGSLTDTDNWHSSVTVLRVFIQNVSLHLGSIDQLQHCPIFETFNALQLFFADTTRLCACNIRLGGLTFHNTLEIL
ncbi:hypothetical protein B0H10DRAFT_422437 [Mycena sp. CBHHK59/15]|nr:hypothetical protein B0H10DRAFT_422437 [Mycena sp. CBHHK59/15]